MTLREEIEKIRAEKQKEIIENYKSIFSEWREDILRQVRDSDNYITVTVKNEDYKPFYIFAVMEGLSVRRVTSKEDSYICEIEI